MFLDRLRYELRLFSKVVWLTPVLVVLGLTLLLALANRGISLTTMARSLAGSLEILLPMAAGLVVATVATRDRAIELQLTMPRRYHRTANLRLLIILFWSAVVSLFTAFLLSGFHYWRLPVQIDSWSEPWRFFAWQLTWLSSTLWLTALGLVLTLLLRSRAASGGLICVLSFAQIIAHDELNMNPWLHPVYLFPLTFTPAADYWLNNRIELFCTALVLFVIAWWLLHFPELLLAQAPGEE
jgi:hypothetical protein